MNVFHMWDIAKNDLKIVIRDTPGLFMLLVTPLVVIVIVSFALGGNSGQTVFSVPIVVQDDGYYSRLIVDQLSQLTSIKLETTYKANGKEFPMTLTRAKQLIPDLKAAIVIPAGFTFAVNSGRRATITVISDPADQTVSNIVREIVTQILSGFNDRQADMAVATETMKLADGEAGRSHIHLDSGPVLQAAATLADELARHPQINIDNQTYRSSSAHKTTPFDANLPGWAVMFLLMGTTFTAITLITEKDEGILRRLQVAPISKGSLLGGKLLGYFIQANVQMAVIFGVGHFVFGMWLGKSITALIALLISLAFAATGLGVLFAALCKTQAQARGIALLVVLLSSALGGSWWPLYIEPHFLQKISHVTLNAWAMDGFNALIVYGRGFAYVTAPICALLGMGAVFFLIALTRFARQECL